MAAADGCSATTQAVVQALWDGIGGCRGLSRHRLQLAYDSLAVASGVRSVAMIDYARTTPNQLAAALQALRAVDGFRGGVLVLDGCCYLADLAHLERRLLRCLEPAGATGPGSNGGGAALMAISFEGSAPATASDRELTVLISQLGKLLVAIQACLQHKPAPNAQSSPPRAWPVLDLGSVPGLPCMPTLNGWLLGYPVMYLVGSYEEASKASMLLSASQLHLFTVRLPCLALQQLRQRQEQRAAAGRGVEVGSWAEAQLMAFSVPAELHTEPLTRAVEAMVSSISSAVEAGSNGDTFPANLWAGLPMLDVKAVGPGAVSL